MSNRLSTGAGCDIVLVSCSTYKVADICEGKIGNDVDRKDSINMRLQDNVKILLAIILI